MIDFINTRLKLCVFSGVFLPTDPKLKKKGYVIKREDVPELLKIGKQHIYVLNLSEDQLHEDDAALRIASVICGDWLTWNEPSEGKSSIRKLFMTSSCREYWSVSR